MSTDSNNLVDGDERDRARVRGLRADRPIPVHHCHHCGTPLTNEATRATGFCCAGCSYVYRLVHEHGLDGYYKIRDSLVAPVGEAVFQPRDYAWLSELQRAAEQVPGTPELTLEVQGISCAGCVWLIEKVYNQQPGALHIETDAQLGRMRLRWTPGQFAAPAFARILQSFNYLAGPLGAEPAVPESRRLVRRVGLCAAFSMNVMLFTLPVYFGMEPTFPYARLFGWLAASFATLSVLAGGGYFFSRAFRALREGVMHIDLPIAVGISGAYVGSLYGLLAGRASFIYFDFVAAFILLMLFGRWAQVTAVERNRRRLLTAQSRPDKIMVITATGATVERAVELLLPGESFEIRSGQVVPVEAKLETALATFGTAWINGESDPRECRAGVRVPSGAVNLGRTTVRLCAVQTWADSLLAQLLRPAQRDGYRHRFLERVITGYLAAIFIMAFGTGFAWWFATHDAVQTWSVVTAVLVVSCPCAIGLAFPLADELATVALRRSGVFVREADLWPRLGRIKKIIFDKTGTLTLETPVLQNPEVLGSLSKSEHAALLALVRDNPHPVSQSLLENLLGSAARNQPTSAAGFGHDSLAAEPSIPDEIKESAGYGVTLRQAAGLWSLGRPGWCGGISSSGNSWGGLPAVGYDTEFAHDGQVRARFSFVDTTRSGAREEIDALRGLGFEIFILSGDRHAKVAAMGAALGLPLANSLGECTALAKADWLRAHDQRDTLMLGDGVNDSLAFDAAFTRGTPVIHRGVLESRADFYYLDRGLAGLRQLFSVNAARRRTQAWLLVFSVAYNALAVGLAAVGQMSPLFAAILMPVSSLITLAMVFLGMRKATASVPQPPAALVASAPARQQAAA